MIKRYNKLIRDRIPEIIKKVGEKPYIKILNKKEYFKSAKKKILEEAEELSKAKNRKKIINEIIDIQELLDVLISEMDLTKAEIKRRQGAKNKKRGGFKKRLFLIKTEK